MKSKVVVVAALLIVFAPPFVAAQALTTAVAGTELFDPLNLFGNGPIGAILNPGELTCPGTQPTGNPLQPCPAGSRIEMRGTMVKSKVASDDAWLAGSFTITGNSNMDSNAIGIVWGEFRLDVDAGEGVWKGIWSGKRQKIENIGWVTHIFGVGHGIAGSVEGKQLRFSEVVTSFTPVSFAYIGNITGKVISPPPSN